MTRYVYKAIDTAGRQRRGNIDAPSHAQAVQQLKALAFVPLRIETAPVRSASSGQERKRAGVFVRNLSMLLQAGYTPDQALGAMCRHPGDNITAGMAAKMLDALRGGASLSEAMTGQPRVFPPHFSVAAAAGQTSGSLGKALSDLSEDEERRAKLVSDVRGALAYPAVLGVGMCIAMIFMMAFVLPRFGAIFDDLGAKTPPGLAELLATSAFLQTSWPALLTGAGLLGAIIFLLLRSTGGRQWLDRTLLKGPVVGPIMTAAVSTRFFQVLGLLLRNGESAAPALAAARRSVGNAWARAQFDKAFQRVRQGESAAAEIAAAGVLPPLAGDLLSASEDAGVMAEGAQRLAALYEVDLERRTKLLVRVSEPLMLGVSGLLIGSMIVSIVSALIGVNETIIQQ